MPVFLFILMIVLTLCYRELRVGVTAEADLTEGTGKLNACILGLTVFKMKFDIDLDNRKVVPRPKERASRRIGKAQTVARKKPNIIHSALTVATNLRVSCVNADVHVGAASDPFLTTLAFGSVRILVCAVLAFIKSRFPAAAVSAPLTPEFHRDSAFIGLSATAYISIADILYGLVLLAVRAAGKKRERARPAKKAEARISGS